MSSPERPVVVAGAGLAGALAAFWLSRTRPVVVVAPVGEASASAAAAGLVNPRMGPQAGRLPTVDAELDALSETLDLADAAPLFRRTGIVRPARDDRQASRFRDADTSRWLVPEAAAERWPHVVAPHGALWVPDGGSVRLPGLLDALLAASGARRVDARVTGWTDRVDGVAVDTSAGVVLASHLVLAVGDGGRRLPAVAALDLHRIKGQTVTVARPAALAPDGPAVAGATYAVPAADGVTLGATYEHAFAHTAPDAEGARRLLAAAGAVVPQLAGAEVLAQAAGVRLTVPEAVAPGRRPVAGRLADRVWVLTGLGSRGLLAAPSLARLLPDALDGRAALPPDVSPARLAAR